MKSRNNNEFKYKLVYGVELGQASTGTTASTYNRMTEKIYIAKPFILEKIKVTINTSQTYTLQLVDSTGATPSVLHTLAGPLSLTGGVENTVEVSPVYLIHPGIIYLSIYCSTKVNYRRGANNHLIYDLCAFSTTGYDGTAPNTGSWPGYLVGSYYDLLQFTGDA